MAHRSKRQPQPLADLYDYLFDRPGELPARELPPVSITITDDWPEFVPVTDQEVRVIEAFFADVLDELFGPIP
ncbi:hypothetical protein [Caulobacter sp. RL271]|uniref:Uncharacterized protein n=1 Tax=Caulobacter segnis TaxID=88688 RepID=A0ABY4ZUV2_9CAUL|nr:hypothetical protein [Caulobacter segnis]USQ96511.1 hypothetical protein MZV50_02650 [Caulobacter segnis]